MALRNSIWGVLILGAIVAFNACRKEVKNTDICLHNASIDYQKRWAIESTTIDVYDGGKKLVSHSISHPNGYFEINADYSYYLYSDDAPVKGTWNINQNCDFVLNAGTAKEKVFAVTKLSDDSLILRQDQGPTVITQKYKAFKCPSLASLQYRWDLRFTVQSPYGVDTVFKNEIVPQTGYFKLNNDASYNVVLAGTPPPPPTTGTWGIANPGCLLVLDRNKPNERSYEVQKVNNDSLVIWRKDTLNKLNLLRHYAKHK